jgi:hypothetical protein
MKRILMILLCWGVLSTMTGCYISPYPYPSYGGYVGTDVSIGIGGGGRGYAHHHHGNYSGYRYGGYSGHRGGYSRGHR